MLKKTIANKTLEEKKKLGRLMPKRNKRWWIFMIASWSCLCFPMSPPRAKYGNREGRTGSNNPVLGVCSFLNILGTWRGELQGVKNVLDILGHEINTDEATWKFWQVWATFHPLLVTPYTGRRTWGGHPFTKINFLPCSKIEPNIFTSFNFL